MNEDKKVYAVFDGQDLMGINEDGWNAGDYKFAYLNNENLSWEDTNISLSNIQVINLLEYNLDFDGDNVYEFPNGIPKEFMNDLKKDTKRAMHRLNSIGDYSNSELIEKLRMEEDGIEEQEKQRLIDEIFTVGDAVKRPSHYMLEDGTEVKNHIRSILGDDGFKSWAIGNAIKYVSRYKDKGKPIQDLKKAQENIQMVIDVLGERDGLD